MADTKALGVETVTRGAVPEDAIDLAVLRVRAALRAAHEPVLFARVKLAMAADAAESAPAVAQASVALDRRRVRGQAATTTMRAAIASMCERLKVRLDRAADDAVGSSRPCGLSWAGGSSRPGGAGRRVDYWTLPQPRRSAEVPSVVRHKSYVLSRLTAGEGDR